MRRERHWQPPQKDLSIDMYPFMSPVCGGVPETESGVPLRQLKYARAKSPGLELYSSKDMKPGSLGDPAADALQLEGRGGFRGSQAEPWPLLPEELLTGLAADGGEWGTGIDIDLLC